ncbi:MAG: M1 family metallopeptidase [Bacteroidota bacterium]
MKYSLALLITLLTTGICSQVLDGRKAKFDRQDTLRGSITPERIWWDLTYYHLNIAVDLESREFKGFVDVHYRVMSKQDRLQIDLQEPLVIDKVIQNGKKLTLEKEGNAHFILLKEDHALNDLKSLRVHYSGIPRKAIRAPWDGGVSWTKDNNGKAFVATSCQGLGASVWWPCKDHMYDEVDSMLISINVPDPYINVSNGRLRTTEKLKDGTSTYHWFVNNPINNYGVNINIGDYVNWNEKYNGEAGELDLDYYVLRDNLNASKEQFKQVPQMMEAFEHWFGPYPFYDDSFKLVEAPYLGMEHQSSVTYGNGYQNGYLGRDLSGSGWGLKFDFIIIHEAGHEWFANNITYKDIADMWIHEGFTAYSESLFVEYHYGKEAGADYVVGTRRSINNDRPIIGDYDVNSEGSGDMYYKGSNLLHTLRQIVGDDDLWRQTLRKMNEIYRHQTVSSSEIEQFMANEFNLKLNKFFDQYLRTNDIPVLEYFVQNGKIHSRWMNTVRRFSIPIEIQVGNENMTIQPKNFWTIDDLNGAEGEIKINRDYYIYARNILEG